MNGSLALDLHGWRGIGPDVEPDLFVWRWRVGFATFSVCRVCVLAAYQDVRAEAARLRATIRTAVETVGGER
jgi:hypothetical protein